MELNNYFQIDRNKINFVGLQSDKIINTVYWLEKSVEERFYAIEFLRHQFMEMNHIEPKMDKAYFDYL